MIDEILNDHQKLFFVILSFVCIVNLVMGFVYLQTTNQFIANSRAVKAKITGFGKANGSYIEANIMFDDSLGKSVKAKVMVDNAKKMKEGDTVEVLSHKESPEKVRKNTFMGIWVMPVCSFGSAASILMALAITYSFGYTKLPF